MVLTRSHKFFSLLCSSAASRTGCSNSKSTDQTARIHKLGPGRVAQSVARLTQEPEVPGSIPGPAIYFRFSFR